MHSTTRRVIITICLPFVVLTADNLPASAEELLLSCNFPTLPEMGFGARIDLNKSTVVMTWNGGGTQPTRDVKIDNDLIEWRYAQCPKMTINRITGAAVNVNECGGARLIGGCVKGGGF